jgi:hypothetical protein
MSHGLPPLLAMLLVVSAVPSLAGPQDPSGKVKVAQPSDLPRHSYTIPGKPSAVLQDPNAMLALALQVEKDYRADLGKYDIQDRNVLQRVQVALYGIAMLKQDHAEARRCLEQVRGLQANPVSKLLLGVITIPYMQAREHPGADFSSTFRTHLSKRLGSLPFEDVQPTLRSMKSNLEGTSRAQLVGAVEASLDPAAQDGKISQEAAEALVSTAMNLTVILPLKVDAVAALEDWLNANGAPQAPKVAAPQAGLGAPKVPNRGAYFGQALPGETPVPFAPEILASLSAWVAGTEFSPDGKYFFASVGAPDYSSARLYFRRLVNGEWTPFAEAPFLAGFTLSNEPVFSADGSRLMFTGRKGTDKPDLWTVSCSEQGWGTPTALPAPINSASGEWRGSTMRDGTFYFTSNRTNGVYQIFKATPDARQNLVVEPLGPPVNTNSFEGDPCIAPDGRFLVFNSARDQKSADLFVSFRSAQGGWGTPINLGPRFNTADDEYGAHLSSDGKYLFFTRHSATGNRIFWVAVSAIDRLRP